MPETSRTPISLVDCDVHPAFRKGLRDLLPYMAETARKRIDFAQSSPTGSNFALPANPLYLNPGGILRRDASVGGIVPGSEPEVMADQLLTAFGVSRAILLASDILGLGALPDPHLSGAIARACNDWLAEQWLQADERYRGTIVIAPQDPDRAADEIARLASDQRFVQVYFPLTSGLMGDPRYYPIYEAAEDVGLPIALHPGAESIYFTGAMPAGGCADVLPGVAHPPGAGVCGKPRELLGPTRSESLSCSQVGSHGGRLWLGTRRPMAPGSELDVRPRRSAVGDRTTEQSLVRPRSVYDAAIHRGRDAGAPAGVLQHHPRRQNAHVQQRLSTLGLRQPGSRPKSASRRRATADSSRERTRVLWRSLVAFGHVTQHAAKEHRTRLGLV